MDQGLFTKHIKNILERDTAKQRIINLIHETTGVTLHDAEVSLSKNTISLTTSSVKRSILIKKGIEDILHKNGFILSR